MSIVNKPNTFVAATEANASEVNENFDTIYDDYNGGITAANLATDSVTTAKIAADAVTAAKIADGAIDSTAQIADGVVTPVKRAGGFKVGTFSITATGSQSITGVGFRPKFIEFSTTDGANTIAMFSRTVYDGTTTSSTGFESSTAAHNGWSATSILIEDRTNATIIAGTFTSLDADGWTMNITTKAANRGFAYVAYG